MRTNKEYQEEVKENYGKSLKEVMHELIVERYMDQWDGSKEWGVPTETSVTWRTRFRLGPDQRRADMAEKKRNQTLEDYKKELATTDIERPFLVCRGIGTS